MRSADASTAPRATTTPRRSAPPWTLLREAVGPRAALRGKVARFTAALARYGRGGELDARLARLHARGVIEAIPTRPQLAAGAIDMLRFFISPAAADYYTRSGIDYSFHQLLRVLDEPASLTDPVGLFSTRDGIIGHLMQVVHANPVYDLQLLELFDDGLDQLEDQLAQMLAGTHPRAGSIGAIVEEPDYHARLLAYVRAWRRDPAGTPPLLRSNVASDGPWRARERTFGSMTSAFRYFARLPPDAAGAARHLARTRAFPEALAEPAG